MRTIHSKHHALLSAPVGAVAALLLDPITLGGSALPVAGIVVYATAVGVLVDLDHFLVARYRTGTWDAVRFCLRHPTAAVLDQSRIFDPGDVGVVSRLCSHLVLSGAVVAALAVASVDLAVLTAVVLYVHLLSDVAWDLHALSRRGAVVAPRAGEGAVTRER